MPKPSTSPAGSRPQLGPGFIVAAAFVGPGTVTTALSVGADWGLSLWWVILFSSLAAMVLQEMAARLGTLSGQGLGEMLRRQSGSRRALIAMIVLVVTAIGLGNAAYQTGNLIGAGLGLKAFLPTSAGLAVLPIAVLSIAAPRLGIALGGLLSSGGTLFDRPRGSDGRRLRVGRGADHRAPMEFPLASWFRPHRGLR